MVGVIVLSKLGLDQFDADDLRLLEVLAGHASVALVNARLYEAQRREAEGAKALLELSRELSAGTELDAVVERVGAGLRGSSGPAGLALAAGSGTARARVPQWLARRRRPSSRAPGDRLPAQRAGARWPSTGAVRDRTRGLIGEASVLALRTDTRRRVCRGADRARGGPCGTRPLARSTARDLDDRQLDLLAGIAAQAKLALTNALSFESLERTFLSTVEALANALEAKDEYTSSHARWIRDMSVKVGEELGLDAATLKRVELGALFHDIGKIGIPASDPDEAGPADRRGAGADRDTSRARRAHPGPDRAARARPSDRSRLPRALRREGLPGSPPARGDPARGADHLRL